MAGRPQIRIAVNVALDAILAAAAVPLSRWIADPGFAALQPLWLLPAGAACLLAAGLPFGLSRQHWRFIGGGDLLGTGAAALLAAAMLALAAWLAGVPFGNPAWPLVLALTAAALLCAAPTRLWPLRARPRTAAEDSSAVLLVGSPRRCRPVPARRRADRRRPLRVIGLLASGRARPAGAFRAGQSSARPRPPARCWSGCRPRPAARLAGRRDARFCRTRLAG